MPARVKPSRPRIRAPRKPTAHIDIGAIERWLDQHANAFTYAATGGRPPKGAQGLVPALMQATGLSERSTRRALRRVHARRRRQLESAATAAAMTPIERGLLTGLVHRYRVGETLPFSVSETLPTGNKGSLRQSSQKVRSFPTVEIPPSPSQVTAAAITWLSRVPAEDLVDLVLAWAKRAETADAASVTKALASRLPRADGAKGLDSVGLRHISAPLPSPATKAFDATRDLLDALDGYRSGRSLPDPVKQAVETLARHLESS